MEEIIVLFMKLYKWISWLINSKRKYFKGYNKKPR